MVRVLYGLFLLLLLLTFSSQAEIVHPVEVGSFVKEEFNIVDFIVDGDVVYAIGSKKGGMKFFAFKVLNKADVKDIYDSSSTCYNGSSTTYGSLYKYNGKLFVDYGCSYTNIQDISNFLISSQIKFNNIKVDCNCNCEKHCESYCNSTNETANSYYYSYESCDECKLQCEDMCYYECGYYMPSALKIFSNEKFLIRLIADGYAYSYFRYLKFYSYISYPNQMKYVSSFGSVDSFAVKGDYILAVSDDKNGEGLYVFKYPDSLKSPKQFSSLNGTSIGGKDIVINGDYVYIVSDYYDKLFILDIKDISNPKIVNSVSIVSPQKVTIDGKYLAILSGNYKILIYSLDNPELPLKKGEINLNSSVNTFRLYKSYLYVSEADSKIHVFDLTYPPSELKGKIPVNAIEVDNVTTSDTIVFLNDKKFNRKINILRFNDGAFSLKTYYPDGTLLEEKKGSYEILNTKRVKLSFSGSGEVWELYVGFKEGRGYLSVYDGTKNEVLRGALFSKNIADQELISVYSYVLRPVAEVNNFSEFYSIIPLKENIFLGRSGGDWYLLKYIPSEQKVKILDSQPFDEYYEEGRKLTDTLVVLRKDVCCGSDKLDIYQFSEESLSFIKVASMDLDDSNYAYSTYKNNLFLFGKSSSNNNDVKIYSSEGKLLKEIDIPYDDGSIENYDFAGNKLYLLMSSSHLVVIDLSTYEIIYDDKPYEDFSSYGFSDIFTLSNKLLLTDSYGNFVVFNISGAFPKKESSFSVPGNYYGIYKVGKLSDKEALIRFGSYLAGKISILGDGKIIIPWVIDLNSYNSAISILDKNTIIVSDNGKTKIVSLKAYDKDFDGIPDYADAYPDDSSKWYVDKDNDGLIDEIKTSPDDLIYENATFDPDYYWIYGEPEIELKDSGIYIGKLNLWLTGNSQKFELEGKGLAVKEVYYWYYSPWGESKYQVNEYDDSEYLYVGGETENVAIYSYEKLPNSSFVQSITVMNSSSGDVTKDDITSPGEAYEVSIGKNYKATFGEEYKENSELSKWIKVSVKDTPTSLFEWKFIVNQLYAENENPGLIISAYTIKDGIDCDCCCSYSEEDLEYAGSYLLNLNEEDSVLLYLPEGTYYFEINPRNIEWADITFSLIPRLTVFNQSFNSTQEVEFTVVIPKDGNYDLFIVSSEKVEKFGLYKRKIVDEKHLVLGGEPDRHSVLMESGLQAGIYRFVAKFKKNAYGYVKLVAKKGEYREIEPNDSIIAYNPIPNKEGVKGTISPGDIDYFGINIDGTTTISVSCNGTEAGDKLVLKVYNPSGAVVKSVPYYASGEGDGFDVDLNLNSGLYILSLQLVKGNSKVDYSISFSVNVSGVKLKSNSIAFSTPFFSQMVNGNIVFYSGNDEVKEESVGNAIIVAGMGDDPADPLHKAFQILTERAYKTFVYRGFTDDDIYYIDAVPEHDIDGDGVKDSVVDNQTVTVDSIKQAIKLAQESNTSQPLYIFVAAHGGNGSLKLGKDSILFASQLQEAIQEFIDNTGREVFLIIEACHSGSFKKYFSGMDKLTLIYSSESKELSFIDPETGTSFSYFFLQYALGGHTIENSIDSAKNQILNIKPASLSQSPGYETWNESELEKLIGMRIATASMEVVKFSDYYGKDPESVDVSENKTVKFHAKLDAGNVIEQVGVFVLPPEVDFSLQDFQTPDFSKYYVELEFNGDENNPAYTGTKELYTNGDYKLVYVAKDVDGNIVYATGELTVTGGVEPESSSTNVSSGTDNGENTTATNGTELTSTSQQEAGVTVDVTLGDENVTETEWEEVVFDVAIHKGWNLISIPVLKEVEVSIFNLAGVSTVWKWEGNKWAVWSPDPKIMDIIQSYGLDVIESIKPAEGFWLKSGSNISLEFTGKSYNGIEEAEVSSGWNLVGTGEEIYLNEVNPNEISWFSNVSTVWKWEGNKWAVWSPDPKIMNIIQSYGLNVVSLIKPGEGFWVNVK